MIIDASVAFKWLVEEEGSQAAFDLIGTDVFVAPDLLIPEVGNAIWKRRVRGEVSAINVSVDTLVRLIDRFEPSAPVAAAALAIAVELGHPIYDCIYLALAQSRGDVLITADRKFLKRCVGSPYSAIVRALEGAD